VKVFQKVINFYIHGSIHVALAIVALMLLSGIYLNILPDFYLTVFVFCAAVSGYNFVKYAGIAKWHHRRLTSSLKSLQILSLIAFFAMLFFFWHLPFSVQVIAVISGLLTLLYAVPLKRKWKNFRSIPGMKLVLIALVLVLTTVLMPAFYGETDIDSTVFLLSLLRFFWVIVLILPFEIRDVQVDSISLGTIPQRLGIFKTKLFGSVLLGVLAFTEIYFYTIFFNSLWAVLIVILLTGLALWFSSEKRSFYYTAFWVEAIPVIWLVIELFNQRYF
jgi:4-hydroxybenzoate polyprenyltransferase